MKETTKASYANKAVPKAGKSEKLRLKLELFDSNIDEHLTKDSLKNLTVDTLFTHCIVVSTEG